jgi:hypothetical protein
MMFRETLLPEANFLDIGEKVAKKSPFRKAGFFQFSPMFVNNG